MVLLLLLGIRRIIWLLKQLLSLRRSLLRRTSGRIRMPVVNRALIPTRRQFLRIARVERVNTIRSQTSQPTLLISSMSRWATGGVGIMWRVS